MRRHKIKVEKPVASTSQTREQEHDLAYYIHDRVELMHQVFSVLKYKELKAMAPECVRHISIGDLQELCTEELLGISSKRLCAVLDGAEPPSDTESSSRSPSPPLETISLDSISSDEEILSESSKKKKHKHRHRSRSKKKKSKEPPESEEAERSRASRAGLTVLELLELQARARAIRAQLQQEQAHAAPAAAAGGASDNEVEIKEEPPDVVEISSDDDKHEPRHAAPQTRQVVRQPVPQTDGKSVTKIGNDLIITTPAKSHRKIKLNRTKPTAPVPVEKPAPPQPVEVDKSKSKKKKKDKKKTVDKEGSDNDEITLQLSDSEKMDLLGSLEQKAFEQPSTEDSESSSDSEGEKGKKDKPVEKKDKEAPITDLTDTISEGDLGIVDEDGSDNKTTPALATTENIATNEKVDTNIETAVCEKDKDTQQTSLDVPLDTNTNDVINPDENNDVNKEKSAEEQTVKEVLEISSVEEIPLVESSQEEASVPKEIEKEVVPSTTKDKEKDKDKSEGEVSDRDSSEVEAFVPPPEVVCISDEDSRKKKKKKKDKKAKKEKKSKKSKPDFRDGSDQNFYPVKDTEVRGDSEATKEGPTDISNQEEDVCVILELSDDSSCYEVEGTLLSKEPTAEEIEALSAKIDEIQREEVVTDEQIREHERMLREREGAPDADNVSWKDRYLDSRKVKEVMSTSNILNAMRKKNKELKKKLEESKKTEEVKAEERAKESLEEGSIEQYNTLQASNKFVNPVKEAEKSGELKTQEEGKVSKEMKKDAKQLLKMYKKLLKYNDINKIRDPSKKKKKRRKHDGVVA